MINVGDKAPEVLGINEKGEEIRLSVLVKEKNCVVLLPKGQYIRLHRTSV